MKSSDNRRYTIALIVAVIAVVLSLSCLVFVSTKLETGQQDQVHSSPDLKSTEKPVPPEPLPTFDPFNFSFSGVSAHKRLLPSRHYVTKPDMVPQFDNLSNIHLLLDPYSNDELIEHVRGVEVMSTGLVVLTSGYYYVYSSIRFNPDSIKPCKEFDSQSWPHIVQRSRPNVKESSGVILTSYHTCCDECVRDKETSYTGGVFFLKAGDHLFVEVSGYALIRFDKLNSFLGLLMFGETFP